MTWTPPTTNVDGTALTDISGYRIFYGTSTTSLSQSLFVAGPSTTSQVVSGLASGTYYFAVAVVNSSGVASNLSNPVAQTIP